MTQTGGRLWSAGPVVPGPDRSAGKKRGLSRRASRLPGRRGLPPDPGHPRPSRGRPELLILQEVTGERETRRRGEGRRLHLAPLRRPGRRAGLDPCQTRQGGGGGEEGREGCCLLSAVRRQISRSPPTTLAKAPPRVARRGAPARARTRPAPRPAALSSCRKFQKLSIIPAQRARAAKAPRRRATCRPAARPALDPPPSRRGSHVGPGGRGPGRPPLPAPWLGGMRGSPGRGLF